MEQLPILNLSDWHAGGQSRHAFITKLADAARRIGFFYLTGHGIELARQQQVLQLARDFFALPLADKLAVKMTNTPHFRGYTRLQGELTLGKPDLREQFDIMQEEIANPPRSDVPKWSQLQGPNQWPSQLPQMKTILLEWQQDLADTSVALLKALAVALEQSETAFDATIDAGPYQHMKLIRYPSANGETSGQGVGAHKDPGYLTLVLQDKQSGLEVQTDDGWLSIPPLEGAFVVNIGELLELASNGKATYHRVTSPPAGVERYSCAFFMAAQLNATVPLLPLPEYLARQAQGPASDPLNPLFHQVGQNVLKGRLRSHPDVAKAHYASFANAI